MCEDDYGTVKPCIEGPPLLIVSVNTCTIDFDLCKETMYPGGLDKPTSTC